MIASMEIGFFELINEEWKIDVVVNQFGKRRGEGSPPSPRRLSDWHH